ncbi:MAG: glutamyl-tRNA reductase [candidate division Zixibacteria bacterium]|nr:glutamyl-tRNA reductase [candidate division Zixibacteria bacterium]
MTRPAHWHLVVCGINHKTSTLEQREPLQIGHDEMARANAVLANLPGVMESVVLSTCNRIELYFTWDHSRTPLAIVGDFYTELKQLAVADLEDCFYVHEDRDTADHLFRVLAGLDSMVLGENQIVGQVRDAYSSACAVKAAGKVLHRLFHVAFRVGKQVRTDTEMGRGACSVSSAAVSMLCNEIGLPARPRALFVGANQMISLFATGLGRLDHGAFHFANRTIAKAEELAAKFDGVWHGLDELTTLLGQVDVAVFCTSATEPLVGPEMIDRMVSSPPKHVGRRPARLVIVDLAIPRDVAIERDYDPTIDVYDLQDIQEWVRQGKEQRIQAIPEAEGILAHRLDEFMHWFDHIRYEPTYNGLDRTFEDIRQEELQNILDRLPAEVRDQLDDATCRLVNRLLQVKIRTSSQNKD